MQSFDYSSSNLITKINKLPKGIKEVSYPINIYNVGSDYTNSMNHSVNDMETFHDESLFLIAIRLVQSWLMIQTIVDFN